VTNKFIQIGDTMYNADRIRSIKDKKGDYVVEFVDGAILKVDFWSEGLDDLHRRGTVIPAQAGFKLLEFYDGDIDDNEALIIAWVIDPCRDEVAATPVTARGVPTDQVWAVMQPDDTVVYRGGVWPSCQAWLNHMKEKQKATKKETA
jgi:hypothetical protein